MVIYLIGLMGSGKSFLGEKIARVLNLSNIDLDNVIETEAGRLIGEIFKNSGESYFRDFERKVLQNLKVDNTVVSCGGGTACFYDNLEFMKKKGVIIFLNPPLNIIWERLKKEKNLRPIISNLSDDEIFHKINDLYIKRINFYQKADLEIVSENPEIIINTISKYLNSK